MAKAQRKEEVATAEGVGAVPPNDAPAGIPWEPPKKLGWISMGVIAGVILLINLPMLHYYLFRSQVPATEALPFRDDFSDPSSVNAKYFTTGGFWRVVDGWLLSPGVRNNPLWLKANLPNDVAVEFDVKSTSPEGDIKVEIFGDGTDHASGYVLIHGGWNNSISIIARLDEHGPSLASLQTRANSQDLVAAGIYRNDTRVRVESSPFKVELGRKYHWRIERRGNVLNWFIDGKPFMRFEDPLPLTGKGHNRFGFSSWEAQLYFDNLTVEAI